MELADGVLLLGRERPMLAGDTGLHGSFDATEVGWLAQYASDYGGPRKGSINRAFRKRHDFLLRQVTFICHLYQHRRKTNHRMDTLVQNSVTLHRTTNKWLLHR